MMAQPLVFMAGDLRAMLYWPAKLQSAPPFSNTIGLSRPANMFEGNLILTPSKFLPYIDHIGMCSSSPADQQETYTELAAIGTSAAVASSGSFIVSSREKRRLRLERIFF